VYLDTAHAVMSEGSLPSDFDYNHVACGVAVLAAIAASDALCCRLLGERPRGQGHREAVTLLATTRSGTGTPAAQAKQARDLGAALATALDLKDESHYGVTLIGVPQVRKVLRAAERLVGAAAVALDRG
jgi:hypothetical protein